MSHNPMFRQAMALIVFLAVTCAGCTASLNTAKMVPQIDYTAFKAGTATVSVSPVTKAEETSQVRKGLSVSASAYQQALVKSLANAGMFQEVGDGPHGIFLLNTEILSQKLVPGMTANAILFVHYELVEKQSGKTLWQESILSQYDSYGGDLPNAVEGSIRSNITKLLAKLHELPELH